MKRFAFIVAVGLTVLGFSRPPLTAERSAAPDAAGARRWTHVFSRAIRLAAQEAGGGRLRFHPSRRRGQGGGRAREHPAARPDADARRNVRAERAVRHADRPGEDARRCKRSHHAPRLHRRRMGRHQERRHDVQRDENVSDHGRRAGVAARPDSRRERLRARLHAAWRRSVRGAAQPEDQVGSSAAADRAIGKERSGANRIGRTGRKGRRRRTGRTASCTSPARITSTTTSASTCWRSRR